MNNLLKAPVDYAKEMILLSFGAHGNKRKAALRVLKQVLALAKQRGYSDLSSFMSHFQTVCDNNQKGSDSFDKLNFDRVSVRYLNDLFEYVSPDEITRLSLPQVSTILGTV